MNYACSICYGISSRGERGVIITIVSFVHTSRWKELKIDFEEKEKKGYIYPYVKNLQIVGCTYRLKYKYSPTSLNISLDRKIAYFVNCPLFMIFSAEKPLLAKPS